jgi:CO/xanthine dehydrogenase Mo-binding subunit
LHDEAQALELCGCVSQREPRDRRDDNLDRTGARDEGDKGAARGPEEPSNLMGRASAVVGDVDAALAAADRVFEHTFHTQAHHQGYLEPHSCTALLAPDGRVQIWSCNKAPYKLREQLAKAFDIPEEQITLHTPAIGGDFGGKGSPMDVPLCLELSRRTGHPVRMTMRYSEELQAAGPRHASVTRVRVGGRSVMVGDGTLRF